MNDLLHDRLVCGIANENDFWWKIASHSRRLRSSYAICRLRKERGKRHAGGRGRQEHVFDDMEVLIPHAAKQNRSLPVAVSNVVGKEVLLSLFDV